MKERVSIRPARRLWRIDFRELYHYRELLYILAYRDLKVRYSQTYIGVLWAVINPVLTIVILHFAFGKVAKVDTGEIPHIVFTIAGLAGWMYFANVASQSGAAILGAQDLIKKIYFPRLLLPVSKAITALIDFGVIILCLIAIMVIKGYPPSPNIAFLPFWLLLIILVALGSGLWISAMTIRYRDFLHLIPLILRVGLFVTPIAYPASMIPDNLRFVLYLNPLAGIVEGARWSVVGGDMPGNYWIASAVLAAGLFFSGLYIFQKMEKEAADVI